MKPYCHDESAGIQIYHGDCREVLPYLSADVVITDPPYNCGKKYGTHNDSMSQNEYEEWLQSVFSFCFTDNLIYFPGTRNVWASERLLSLTRFRPHRMLGWHKREFAGDKWTGGPAMCWEPVVWASAQDKPDFERIYGHNGRDFLIVPATHNDPFTSLHPCPKPEPVMMWLVRLFCSDGGSLIDPFCGTGTTLRAAKDLGRKAIGIEIEERYCEIAARRLEQGVLNFTEG